MSDGNPLWKVTIQWSANGKAQIPFCRDMPQESRDWAVACAGALLMAQYCQKVYATKKDMSFSLVYAHAEPIIQPGQVLQ